MSPGQTDLPLGPQVDPRGSWGPWFSKGHIGNLRWGLLAVTTFGVLVMWVFQRH